MMQLPFIDRTLVKGLFPGFAGLLLVFLIGSCATEKPLPSAESRLLLGNMGVTAIGSVPNVDFHTYARGWAQGAAKGGVTGLFEGLFNTLVETTRNPPTGPYAGPAILITTVILTVTSTITSGIAGGLTAVPKKTAEETEREIQKTIGDVNLADDLASNIVKDASRRPDIERYPMTYIGIAPSPIEVMMPQWNKQGIDTLVEVQVTDAGFRGGQGTKPSIRFYLNARIRLLATQTNREIFTRDFQFLSREHLITDWFANRSQELMSSFTQAMQDLAERIIDELFIVTRFPFDSGYWTLPGQPEFGACWFRPLYPVVKYTSLADSIRAKQPGIQIRYTTVDSLRPTLIWEAFPRPRDQKPENRALLERITHVTYDLKIWEAPNDYPQQLVVDVIGLNAPQYQPAIELKPETKYFWTFRTRYQLDGQPNASRWAFSNIPSNVPGDYPVRPAGGNCDIDAIPSTNYYRFKTPRF